MESLYAYRLGFFQTRSINHVDCLGAAGWQRLGMAEAWPARAEIWCLHTGSQLSFTAADRAVNWKNLFFILVPSCAIWQVNCIVNIDINTTNWMLSMICPEGKHSRVFFLGGSLNLPRFCRNAEDRMFESTKESFRIRCCVLYFYLEDGTIMVRPDVAHGSTFFDVLDS